MTTLPTLREQAAKLIAERDLRFYTEENLYKVLANESAGERARRFASPVLQTAGQEQALRDALNVTYLLMDVETLMQVIHCLKFCPKTLVRS